jgi:glyoxylase-like metal-dependent hydrolase (beta-lactamase superfamily II)
MIIKQIEGDPLDNFSYIIGCEKSGEAIIIDPGPCAQKLVDIAVNENLEIKLIVNTHGHSDHTAGNEQLKDLTGAKIFIHSHDVDRYPQADQVLKDETQIQFGEIRIDVIQTPGHTPGGICLYSQGNLFTGDTLFVGDSGRTDLPGGDRPTLGASIRKLMQLPDDTIVWPGHNYGPTPTSTIGWEKRNNINAKEYGYFVSD